MVTMTDTVDSQMCHATLTHTHGTSGCWGQAGHDGRHWTICEVCDERGDDGSLSWDTDHEEWRP